MSTDPPGKENPYFIDPETGAELARLLYQDQLTTQSMGGPLPERPDCANIQDILDIACGPGGWVLDMAFEHPKARVIGIDISTKMIQYARSQAWSQGLDNASFIVMDALKPLEFPDTSFDLVNARLLIGFMAVSAWPKFVQECYRITRPQGFIRLNEAAAIVTSSLAFEKMNELAMRALYKAGQVFSPNLQNDSFVPSLERYMTEVGYQHIQQTSHPIDFSVGTEGYRSWYQDYRVGYQLLQPFLIKMGVGTQEEIEHHYQQMLIEMLADDFTATQTLVTLWGEK